MFKSLSLISPFNVFEEYKSTGVPTGFCNAEMLSIRTTDQYFIYKT